MLYVDGKLAKETKREFGMQHTGISRPGDVSFGSSRGHSSGSTGQVVIDEVRFWDVFLKFPSPHNLLSWEKLVQVRHQKLRRRMQTRRHVLPNVMRNKVKRRLTKGKSHKHGSGIVGRRQNVPSGSRKITGGKEGPRRPITMPSHKGKRQMSRKKVVKKETEQSENSSLEVQRIGASRLRKKTKPISSKKAAEAESKPAEHTFQKSIKTFDRKGAQIGRIHSSEAHKRSSKGTTNRTEKKYVPLPKSEGNGDHVVTGTAPTRIHTAGMKRGGMRKKNTAVKKVKTTNTIPNARNSGNLANKAGRLRKANKFSKVVNRKGKERRIVTTSNLVQKNNVATKRPRKPRTSGHNGADTSPKKSRGTTQRDDKKGKVVQQRKKHSGVRRKKLVGKRRQKIRKGAKNISPKKSRRTKGDKKRKVVQKDRKKRNSVRRRKSIRKRTIAKKRRKPRKAINSQGFVPKKSQRSKHAKTQKQKSSKNGRRRPVEAKKSRMRAPQIPKPKYYLNMKRHHGQIRANRLRGSFRGRCKRSEVVGPFGPALRFRQACTVSFGNKGRECIGDSRYCKKGFAMSFWLSVKSRSTRLRNFVKIVSTGRKYGIGIGMIGNRIGIKVHAHGLPICHTITSMPDQWFQLTITRHRRQTKLYINGKQVILRCKHTALTVIWKKHTRSRPNGFLIGSVNTSPFQNRHPSKIYIDEFRFWEKYLSATDARKLYLDDVKRGKLQKVINAKKKIVKKSRKWRRRRKRSRGFVRKLFGR
jgi:hypothetical protein